MSLMYSVPIFQFNSMFTEEESIELSKQRIIQKNLVHFQGFPDRLYNKELLLSQEYFGQYGTITKIILTNKIDKKTKKRANSAYITFSTYEQAAYAILSVDSIKIDNQLVRAFFGTTKYCNHFLNNFKCFNSEKCMFLHYIADKNDIIADNSKFGYSEHIKLAKKIIGFGSLQSQLYVINNTKNKKSILPSIVTIYHKDDILIKTQNHRRKRSNGSNASNSSLNNFNNNDSNNRTRSSSNNSNSNRNTDEEKKEKVKKNEFSFINNINIINNKHFNSLFKARNESRFNFTNNIKNNIYNNIDNNNNSLIEITQELIDELSLRLGFFIQFDKNISLSKVEYDFCDKLFTKSKNDELKKIDDCKE